MTGRDGRDASFIDNRQESGGAAASQDIVDFCVRELVKLAFPRAPLDLLMAGSAILLLSQKVCLPKGPAFRSVLD